MKKVSKIESRKVEEKKYNKGAKKVWEAQIVMLEKKIALKKASGASTTALEAALELTKANGPRKA